MTATKNIFRKYLNNVFIETGSFYGDGISLALEAGFKKIYSIELSPHHHKHCIERFKYFPQVTLILGDSYLVLPELLKTINEPITFWLDGHYSEGDTVMSKYESPLMQELDAINNHSINTHTIIIDDLRCWNKEKHGFDTEIIKTKCLEINPNYSFIFEDGYVASDILVAKILL